MKKEYPYFINTYIQERDFLKTKEINDKFLANKITKQSMWNAISPYKLSDEDISWYKQVSPPTICQFFCKRIQAYLDSKKFKHNFIYLESDRLIITNSTDIEKKLLTKELLKDDTDYLLFTLFRDMDKETAYSFSNGSKETYSIKDKYKNAFVGFINLEFLENFFGDKNSLVLSFFTFEQYRQKKYCLEAIECLVNALKEKQIKFYHKGLYDDLYTKRHNPKVIYTTIYKANIKSINLVERIGFEKDCEKDDNDVIIFKYIL